MDLHTFWAILAGWKKDRYLIVDEKVINTALIIEDEEDKFILDFGTLFQYYFCLSCKQCLYNHGLNLVLRGGLDKLLTLLQRVIFSKS